MNYLCSFIKEGEEMDKPTINSFSNLIPLFVQKYERYLPNAFDDSLSILEKMNKIIDYLNQIGELSNSVIDQWNQVMAWVESDGLQQSVETTLNEWYDNGKITTIVDNLLGGLTKLTTSFNDFVVDIRDFNPHLDGLTDDTTALSNAISTLSEGSTLLIPKGQLFLSSPFSITKRINIRGTSKPIYSNHTLIKGTVILNAGLQLNAEGIVIENLGIQCPNQSNGIEGINAPNSRIENVSTISQDHGFLMQDYLGSLKGTRIINCDSYDSVHGFISKSESISVLNCRAHFHSGYGFGIISDNIPSESQIGNAKNNQFTNIWAENCHWAFASYCRDYFSPTNANNVDCSDNVLQNLIDRDCDGGIFIGDPTSSSSPHPFPVKNFNLDGFVQRTPNTGALNIHNVDGLNLSNLNFTGLSFTDSGTVKNINLSNLMSDNKVGHYSDLKTLTVNSTTPTLSYGMKVYQTANTQTTLITNFLGGKPGDILILKIRDGNTGISASANIVVIDRDLQRGFSSTIVFLFQDGVWFELFRTNDPTRYTNKNLISDGNAIDVSHNSIIEILNPSGTTSNKISFTGVPMDRKIFTVVIRPTTSGTFTFGGFASNIGYPSDLPLSVTFGTMLICKCVYVESLPKFIITDYSINNI